MKNSKVKKIAERIDFLKKISFLDLGAKECQSSESGLDLICVMRKHEFIYNQFKKTASRCARNEIIPVLKDHLSEDKIELIKHLTKLENAGETFDSLCDNRIIKEDGEIFLEVTSKGLDVAIMNGFNTCLDVFFSNFGWMLDSSCLSASKLSIKDVHCILTYADFKYKKHNNIPLEEPSENVVSKKEKRREDIRDISHMFFA